MTTPLSPEPEQPRRSRHLTWKTARPALAASAVALSVFGLSQVGTTSAAFQDTAQATSGGLTVAGNVLPAVSFSSVKNSGLSGTQWCDLTWPHLGYPYTYRTEVYLNNTGSPVWTGNQDPGANAAAGTSITRGVGSSETNYHFTQTRYFTARVYTVNSLTGEKSADWRGQEIKRRAATYEGTCNGDAQSITTSDSPTVLSRIADRESAATPDSTPAVTAPTTTSTSTSSPEPTTTAGTTTTTTAPSTTTTTTTSTTTAADTPLGATQTSPSGYTATLVKSPDSETAIVIEDASGDELHRISVSSSATYEWDEASDALWITDGGKVYKASGSSWTKTIAERPSGDASQRDTTTSDAAPADDSALTE